MKALLLTLLLAAGVAGVLSALGYPVLSADWMPVWPSARATATLRIERLAGPRATDATPGGPLETQRLLRDGRFEELTARLETAASEAAGSWAGEHRLAAAVRGFAVADPGVGTHIDAWAAAAPASFAPRLARAAHLLALAEQPRDDAATAGAPASLHDELAAAAHAAREALAIAPELMEAQRILIRTATLAGDVAECLRFGADALAVTPRSVRVRRALAHCLLPRHGGSYDMVDAFVRETAPQVATRPALRALGGIVAWDRGRAAAAAGAPADAVALYDQAIAAADDWEFRLARATSLAALGRTAEALADLDRAAALRPEEPVILVARADVLARLGHVQRAVDDLRLVEEMDPASRALAAFRRRELARAAAEAGAMLGGRPNVRGAVRRLTDAIMLTGGDPVVFRMRGLARLRLGDETRALPDFLDAIRRNDRDLESYRRAGALLGKRGAWTEAAAQWTRYLALDPESGEALLGRARARASAGDTAAAAADARAACRLGVRDACDASPAAGG